MLLKLVLTNKFEKDLNRAKKRGKELKKFYIIVRKLVKNEKLVAKYKNHKLKGNYKNRWELHIEDDWFLVYKKEKNTIILERTGSHSDLF